jgi:TonB family protein
MKSKKLNIMKTRPQISDHEIHAMMDFDKVLQLHKSAKRWKYISIITGSAVAIALIIGWAITEVDRSGESPAQQAAVVVPEKKQPITTPDQKQEQTEQQEKKVVTKSAEAPVKQTRDTGVAKAPEADVYVEATPVKGYDDLYAYFDKELTYPVNATVAAEGDVAVTFVINKDGKPEQIKFLNSLGPEFDKEVIRVINNMPGWKPATENGKPVRAKINQSFTFSINN